MARNDCLRIHGSNCSICGFDFGQTYGEAFTGKIHVHHIVPLHTINKKYEINPERDLIPVCPNCHIILHSEPDGVYIIEEVQK
ncbi:MAG: HNH endonuclease [Oscillospiraceae bacterium]